jgi:hypothetical protein
VAGVDDEVLLVVTVGDDGLHEGDPEEAEEVDERRHEAADGEDFGEGDHVERRGGADLLPPPPHQVHQRRGEQRREDEVRVPDRQRQRVPSAEKMRFVCRIGSGGASPACTRTRCPSPPVACWRRGALPCGGGTLRRTSIAIGCVGLARRRSTARRQGGGAEQWPEVWGFDLGGGLISTRGGRRRLTRGGGAERGRGRGRGRWRGRADGVDLRKRADDADLPKAEPGEAAYLLQP